MYVENPKTKGSGILCCIPQVGRCPVGCEDCFFQTGRSYLEPLCDNLPNAPSQEEAMGCVIRMNDGNDSNVDRKLVMETASSYPMKFYNTAIPRHLEEFDAPVVLTVNPGDRTNGEPYLLEDIPVQLMFVRVRVNSWNLDLVDRVVEHYSANEIPIVFSFMAYFKLDIPEEHRGDYVLRKRITNEYYAITTDAWERIMSGYKYSKWVYSCGKVDGEKGITSCRHCGNCIREYFVTTLRIRDAS